MATTRKFICVKCGQSAPAGNLFDDLRKIAKGKSKKCGECKSPLNLLIKFPFSLGAKDSQCTVTHAFVPRHMEKWNDSKGRKVEFYPFLVVLKRHGRGRAVWLPYWHVVKDGNRIQKKYGQWAPFMDERLFSDLLAQAKAAGLSAK